MDDKETIIQQQLTIQKLLQQLGNTEANTEKRMFKIKFDVHIESHDGYCSDAYDETSTNTVETELHPLPEGGLASLFEEKDVDEDGKILNLQPLEKLFESEWCHGNGYCGCRCWKKIKSARIIEKRSAF